MKKPINIGIFFVYMASVHRFCKFIGKHIKDGKKIGVAMYTLPPTKRHPCCMLACYVDIIPQLGIYFKLLLFR